MNSSRDKIFAKLSKFKNPASLEIKTFESDYEDLVEEFIKNATLAGAKTYATTQEIDQFYTKNINTPCSYQSTLGVAENGALWCCDLSGEKRVNLFTCTELIMMIKKENIVSNMHEAYKYIDLSKREFATFIAGPSKTADIEQSLVIGAHGAMELHIILLD